MDLKLNIFPSEQEVLSAIAAYFIKTANEAIVAQGFFNVSLSGGTSPKKLYQLLTTAEYKLQLDWTKVYFFFGDERNVPQNSPDSNFLMVKTALFDPLNIQADHIFAVDTTVLPESAAIAYAEQIDNHFKNQEVKFDLILLGLGDNSHTASLFPHTDVLAIKEATVKEVFLEDQQIYRITKTAKMINQAHHIAFLLYGAGKAEAVKHVLEDPTNIEEYPAQLIKPDNGDVQWFMDEAAAALLQHKS
ncbi:MAG: 6-phosphogluconolactonase [Sphingobacteriaceae bacterium]|nr:MAG: 6-phosphogluconolactonase [Sphingobacteriaceae bacterium]